MFCGCLAVVCLFSYSLDKVPILIFMAIAFDYADGMAARFLNVHSPMGKELDSLADMVTFGFVPGAIMFTLIKMTLGAESIPFEQFLQNPPLWIAFTGFAVTIFSALRLAKFNLDTRQSDGFIGLPTPSSTVFIVGLLMIILKGPFEIRKIILDTYLLSVLSFVIGYLLIAELPMTSLKFSNFGWKGNELRYIGILTGVLMLVFLGHLALSLGVLIYVLFSLANMVFKK